MGRSRGFGSAPYNMRPVRTRFRCGSVSLDLTRCTAQLAGSLCKRHAVTLLTIGLQLLVGLRVQGLFHSPRRGAFHLSLTVLVHYRSPGSI